MHGTFLSGSTLTDQTVQVTKLSGPEHDESTMSLADALAELRAIGRDNWQDRHSLMSGDVLTTSKSESYMVSSQSLYEYETGNVGKRAPVIWQMKLSSLRSRQMRRAEMLEEYARMKGEA